MTLKEYIKRLEKAQELICIPGILGGKHSLSVTISTDGEWDEYWEEYELKDIVKGCPINELCLEEEALQPYYECTVEELYCWMEDDLVNIHIKKEEE